ncbi:MAG: restriction endonuclease subunit S [Alphaproteobacteria bacterium]|nr:restriction endonuclease subunit S [Alphaproteobacteria bacterium]
MQNNQNIPEGWNISTLKNCVKIFGRIGYRGYTCADIVKKGDGAITLSPSNIIDNKINYDENTYISWYKYEESPEIKIQEGDIIFVKTGSSFGKSAIIKHLPEPATINPQLIIFKNFSGKQEYFAYLVASNSFQKKVHQTVVGGTIPTLSQEEIYKYAILLPPLVEQKKIAEILGTWDEAIEKLSDLIEQKKLLKKGLMQKLLTGKTRLPGFTQPWKDVKLSDFLKEHIEKTTISNQHQVLSVTKNGICSQEEYFEKQIASENNIGYKILRKHNVVFSPMNLWMGSIGFSEYDIGIVSPAYKIFTVNEDVALFSFLKHFMIIDRMIYLYLINSEQGASIVRRNLDLDGLLSSKVSIPDIAEQQAIADVFLTVDDEINLLNQKLEALKEQKKGLMQQLLTGQIRVKVN